MTRAEDRPLLLAALVILAAAGLALHLRSHPLHFPAPGPGAVAATVLSLADLVLVTALFLSRRTAVYGHLLNGFLVIYGTVLMGHLGLAALSQGGAVTVERIVVSPFPDIGVAWVDFLVGALLHKSWLGRTEKMGSDTN